MKTLFYLEKIWYELCVEHLWYYNKVIHYKFPYECKSASLLCYAGLPKRPTWTATCGYTLVTVPSPVSSVGSVSPSEVTWRSTGGYTRGRNHLLVMYVEWGEEKDDAVHYFDLSGNFFFELESLQLLLSSLYSLFLYPNLLIPAYSLPLLLSLKLFIRKRGLDRLEKGEWGRRILEYGSLFP